MKKVVVVFAVFGMISGLLFAMGPFFLAPPNGTTASFVMPVVLGLVLTAAHVLNWKRLRGTTMLPPRWLLLAFNLALLVLFLIGFVVMYRIGTTFPHEPLRLVAFLVLWPLPLAVNAVYLCAPSAVSPG
jgi:hypothetical protein